MTTIDYEEGEVEDLSGSDHEDSGHEYTDYGPPKYFDSFCILP